MLVFASPDFDIDAHSGFLPNQIPLRRLAGTFEFWELLLDDALSHFVHTGASPLVSKAQVAFADLWRKRLRKASRRTAIPFILPLTRIIDCSRRHLSSVA